MELVSISIQYITLALCSHSWPTSSEITTHLQRSYNSPTVGECNSVVPVLDDLSPLYFWTLYHQMGKPEQGFSLQPAPAPLCLAGWLAGSCLCLGFLASISEWAACASSQTISPVKYCDSLVNCSVQCWQPWNS